MGGELVMRVEIGAGEKRGGWEVLDFFSFGIGWDIGLSIDLAHCEDTPL